MQTFDLAELGGDEDPTLFQRSKGRDVVDLWLAVTQLGVDPGSWSSCTRARRCARDTVVGRRRRVGGALCRNWISAGIGPAVAWDGVLIWFPARAVATAVERLGAIEGALVEQSNRDGTERQ